MLPPCIDQIRELKSTGVLPIQWRSPLRNSMDLHAGKEAGTGPTIRTQIGESKVDVRRNNRELEDWLNGRMKLLHHERKV